MSRRVRVLLYLRDDDPDGITRAYHRVSRALSGIEGLLGNELLRSAHDPCEFAVLSEWESMAAFQAWERRAEHRHMTAPLRPYQDRTRGVVFAVYAVEAAYPKETDQ